MTIKVKTKYCTNNERSKSKQIHIIEYEITYNILVSINK